MAEPSQYAAELCCLLVKDIFGQLSSTIFSILLQNGRLTLPQLLRISRLPSKHARPGLVVLIQQHLVLHFTSRDDLTTYYEADWRAAYNLVRIGKAIRLVNERLGDAAGRILLDLSLQGHARVGDLAQAYGVSNKDSLRSGKVNGIKNSFTNGDHETALRFESFNSAIKSLLASRFVCAVQVEHLRPKADNENEAERLAKASVPPGSKPKKDQELVREKTRERLRLWRDGADIAPQVNGRKRSLHQQARLDKLKRIKLDHDSDNETNGYDSGSEYEVQFPVDADLVIRVNYEKLSVVSRNEQLTTFAEQRFGPVTAKVYAEFLKQVEYEVKRCKDKLREPEDLDSHAIISTLDISITLDPNLALGDEISNHSFPESQRNSGKRKSNGIIIDDESDKDDYHHHNGDVKSLDSMDDDRSEKDGFTSNTEIEISGTTIRARTERRNQIRQHLLIIHEQAPMLLQRDSDKEFGRWSVDFEKAVLYLKQLSLENIIMARFGPWAARLVRLLNDKGKLDEKFMASKVLLKAKDVRQCLMSLLESGFLQLQEIPKDPSRQPGRTIYLWAWDCDRAGRSVLEDCFKTMARSYQRIEYERSLRRVLLDKASRTDVIGKENQFLSPAERGEIRKWREVEEKLLVQIGRLDDLVDLFNNF